MKRKNGFIESTLMLLCALMTTVNALDEIPDDMSKWKEQGTVLRKGGSWDNHDAWFVEDVIKVDGKYYLYWIGGQKSCWGDGGGYSCVGLATSTDGKNFTKHSGNPVIRPEQASYVSSWEHGCRNATFCRNDNGKFIAYVTVDFSGNSTPGIAPKSEWGCDVSVDSKNHVFTSNDGVNWTYEGPLGGVDQGGEMSAGVVKFHNGSYYFWPHQAEPNMNQGAAKGSNYKSLSWQGWIGALNFGWSEVEAFIHDDNNTVTLIYWPFGGGHSGSGSTVWFATSSLSNMTDVSNKRKVRSGLGSWSEWRHSIIKDVEAGEWKWYYGSAGKVELRT